MAAPRRQSIRGTIARGSAAPARSTRAEPLGEPEPVADPTAPRKIVDFALIDPLDNVLTDDQKLAGTAARVVSKAGERAQFGSTVDSVLHESADSYAQTRLLYTQHRRYELKQEEDAIDPYAE